MGHCRKEAVYGHGQESTDNEIDEADTGSIDGVHRSVAQLEDQLCVLICLQVQ